MAADRPRLDLPRSGLETVCEIVAALGLVLMVVSLASTWSQLPDTVPRHFNAAG